MKSPERLLEVSVIAIAFRSGLEAAETFQTALAIDPHARCWAIVPSTEATQVRSAWPDAPDQALLIIHSQPEEGARLACDLLESLPSGPAAVLLANFPSSHGLFRRSQRKSELEFVRRIESAHSDVQVHLHQSDWVRHPPRVR